MTKKSGKQTKEQRLEKMRQYQKRAKNTPAYKKRKSAWFRNWKSAHLDEYRTKRMSYDLKRLYGLSHDAWQTLWDQQNGRCRICETIFDKPNSAYVDHCHVTGKVRGLLCIKCNAGIGMLNDSAILCEKAARYLTISEDMQVKPDLISTT